MSKIKRPPEYPSYGNKCNGCGECCKYEPCPTSKHYNLWVNGKCKALVFKGSRYWCKCITEPEKINKSFLNFTKAKRMEIMGIGVYCDTRPENLKLMKILEEAGHGFNK